MKFTDAEIDELREIYREDFGEEITREQAAEMGTRLVRLIALLRRSPPAPSQANSPDLTPPPGAVGWR